MRFLEAQAALGITLALAVEGVAVGWGLAPPISDLVATQTLGHWRLTVVVVLLFGVLVRALVPHFTGWRP